MNQFGIIGGPPALWLLRLLRPESLLTMPRSLFWNREENIGRKYCHRKWTLQPDSNEAMDASCCHEKNRNLPECPEAVRVWETLEFFASLGLFHPKSRAAIYPPFGSGGLRSGTAQMELRRQR